MGQAWYVLWRPVYVISLSFRLQPLKCCRNITSITGAVRSSSPDGTNENVGTENADWKTVLPSPLVRVCFIGKTLREIWKVCPARSSSSCLKSSASCLATRHLSRRLYFIMLSHFTVYVTNFSHSMSELVMSCNSWFHYMPLTYTLCLAKSKLLFYFNDNFGKCGPISIFFYFGI